MVQAPGARIKGQVRHCDLCGLEVHRCLAWKSRQPNLWLFRHNQVKGDTGRPSPITAEDSFANDSMPILNPDTGTTAQSGEAFTQTEQTHKRNARLESELDREQEDLLAKRKELDKETISPSKTPRRRLPAKVLGYGMLGIGAASLLLSAIFSSTTSAFIGLGLTLWGALLLYVRPQKYVRSDLLDSTALSSLRTIDAMMTDLGYLEKGIYIPGGNPKRAIVFVPSEPFGRIPKAEEIEGETFIKNPKGIAMVPPGLALANLIEKGLGVDLTKCSLDTLSKRLPKVLIENLEMATKFEMHVDGDKVRFNFGESIYSDFCHKLSSSTRVCSGLGCPICSAMACVLTISTGKPVSFEGDKTSPDGQSLESSYRILEA